MSKTYIVAINWDKLSNGDKINAVHKIDISDGDDISFFVGSHKYHEGWRVYAYNKKARRDDIAERARGEK